MRRGRRARDRTRGWRRRRKRRRWAAWCSFFCFFVASWELDYIPLLGVSGIGTSTFTVPGRHAPMPP
jgi:hypothetical protein